jgi:two-component sensor histidine kinase
MSPQRWTPSDASAPDLWLFLEEIEHRVANEYAMAISSLLLDKRAEARSPGIVLERAVERWRNLASAHRCLMRPAGGEPVDLAVHLRSICTALCAVLEGRRMELTLLEQSVLVTPDQAWRTGLIIHELVINAVKHSQGGREIIVEMSRNPADIECRVSNRGSASNAAPGQGSRITDALAFGMGACIKRRYDACGAMVAVSLANPNL